MLIIDNKVTFKRASVGINDEGSQYPIYTDLLVDIDCNLQYNYDGSIYPGQYGITQKSDVYILYTATPTVSTVIEGDRAIVEGITYSVDKIMPYSLHTEFLLSKEVI